MSDSDQETLTELHNLVGGGKKRLRCSHCCCCCVTHPKCCAGTLSVLTAFCLVVVILGAVFQDKIDSEVQHLIGEHAKLTKGSAATDQFIHSSAPLYTNYYFFNITNAHEVLHKGAHPHVEQTGPYAFRENRTAYNLKWSDDETILKYSTAINFEWDPNKSKGDPDKDYIIGVNVPLVALFKTVEGMDSKIVDYLLKAIDKVKGEFKWDGLFAKRTVSSLVWGYTDPILEALHKAHHLLHFIPEENPVFSYANKSTVEEPNMVYTGVNDLKNVSRYIQWNNFTKMKWQNHYAAMINGTGGYSFHPGVTRDETLEVFIDELQRSGYFKYGSDMLDHGITLYKFILPEDELLNTTQAAAGFPSDNPNGVLNLSPVEPANAPIYASKPHFLQADPGFRVNVTGLNPDPEIHDSYVGVEPITGAVMNAAKRIQANIKLDRMSFSEFESLPDTTMVPIYYAEQTGAVTPELANEFKDAVFTVRYGIMGSVWAVIGLAGLISLISVMCIGGMWIRRCRDRHNRRRGNLQYAGL